MEDARAAIHTALKGLAEADDRGLSTRLAHVASSGSTWRVEGGQIMGNWVLLDMLELFNQMGIDLLRRPAKDRWQLVSLRRHHWLDWPSI